MLFPTLDFALFFVVVFAASWSLAERAEARKVFLLAASYFFYGYWDWRFMLLLAGSSLINFWAGQALALERRPFGRKLVVAVAVTLNLSILGFFKYYGFFLDSLGELLFRVGLERDLPLLEIILPVGISFFTFQGISYVVDVYRRDVEPVTSPIDLFLYISFFPQLVAGPIVRAAHFLPQLAAPPRLDRGVAALGLMLILFGLFKKMVVAQYLAEKLVDPVFFDPWSYGTADLLLGVYGYAVQIYADFSGYSDIAIGTAALLGYRFLPNFDQPYRATSLREFWRRWNISLSTWLRDYLYKPLGGSRGSSLRTVRNMFITMFLGGLWHGAAWTFVLWGSFHGLALGVERLVHRLAGARAAVVAVEGGGAAGVVLRAGDAGGRALAQLAGLLVTFHLIGFGWILFRSPDMEIVGAYLEGLGQWSVEAKLATPFVMALVFGSLAMHFAPADLAQRCARPMARFGFLGLGLFFGVAVTLISAVSPEGVAPFIYFQF